MFVTKELCTEGIDFKWVEISGSYNTIWCLVEANDTVVSKEKERV